MKSNSLNMSFMSPSIHNQNFPMTVQQVLLNPIPERCRLLSDLIQELSLKELRGEFPSVLEHIFGFGNHSGWGLKSIFRNHHSREFDAIWRFLAPEGPLLRAAYKLLSDTHARFQFPVACLPVSTQNMFEEGTVSPLYSNKVPYHGPGRSISHVLLNAFDFFIFHFAYLVVNPNQQKAVHQPADEMYSLYSKLITEYLHYFLPLDGGNVPSIPSLGHTSLSSLSSFSSNYTSGVSNPNLSANSSYFYSSPISPINAFSTPLHPHHSASHSLAKRVPALLKTMPNSSLSPISSSAVLPSGAVEYTHQEIWRSEVIVMILVEFWLSLGYSNLQKTSFGFPGFTMTRLPHEVLGFDRQMTLVSAMLSDSFAPSQEHMTVVWIFVKHLHYFSNSSKPAVRPSWNLPAQQTPLDEFKVSVISHFVQKKLYKFLRLAFQRWPLDATFHLPLETWLRYIQPWRYVDPVERDTPNRDAEGNEVIDSTWQKFVTENLLFYTIFFQCLLPRFFRLDLTSEQNSYNLFRVAKVFAPQNLKTMIGEAEKTLQGKALSWLSTSGTPCPAHTSTVAGTLRQHIAELEGPGFIYTSLFSSTVQEKVLELLQLVIKSRTMVEKISNEQESKKGGWFQNKFSSYFNPPDDDYTTDCKRVILNLQRSTIQLCYLFGISKEQITENVSSSCMPSTSATEPEYSVNRHGPHLTPLGRHQLIRKMCKANVQYRGNPDLQPIRSYEVAFLTRLFHHLSSHLNEKYGIEIVNLYSREDLLGKVSRQVLAPPITCCKLLKNGTMKDFKWEEEVLPPRINLRILAHKQVLGYILALYFVAYVFGFGLFSFFLIMATIFFLFVVAKAVFSKTDRVTPS